VSFGKNNSICFIRSTIRLSWLVGHREGRSLARVLLESDRQVKHLPRGTAGSVHAEETVPLKLEPVIRLKIKVISSNGRSQHFFEQFPRK
jgi:hypothetical protein